MPFPLSDRAVLSVSGPEAKSFLQGLVTNDVTRLAPGQPLYAALLTPQGKILFDFLLHDGAADVLIDCSADAAPALLKRLTMYRLRAKVELAQRPDLTVTWSPETFDGAAADPRVAPLGSRKIVAGTGLTGVCGTYLGNRLLLGVPENGDFGSDKMFALDAGLDELHGVSFDKGCYVGQELTSRMKHRSTARRRLLPIAAAADGQLPPAGTDIRSGQTSLGEITSTYGVRGFASIRLDRLAEAQSPFHAGDTIVTVTKPAWLTGQSGT